MSVNSEPLKKRLRGAVPDPEPATEEAEVSHKDVREVPMDFKEVLALHKDNNEKLLFLLDDYLTKRHASPILFVPPIYQHVREIPMVKSYVYPLTVGMKLQVRYQEKKKGPFIMTLATLRGIARTVEEERDGSRAVKEEVKAIMEAQSKGLLVEVTPAKNAAVAAPVENLEPATQAMNRTAASPNTLSTGSVENTQPAAHLIPDSEMSSAVSYRAARASTVEPNFGVERHGANAFPFMVEGPGKVLLVPGYEFLIPQASLNAIAAANKTAESYIPALMDELLGLKTREGVAAIKQIMRKSTKGGVTNWIGAEFLDAMKSHVYPLVEKGKLKSSRCTKPENVTFLVNKHLGIYK